VTDQPLAPEVHLEVRDLWKHFGGEQALAGVGLTVRSGEIHALAGGNGSGKSTIIKIVAGLYRGDAGTVAGSGLVVDASKTSPQTARQMGFRFVHQNAGIFPDLSVAENLAIGDVYPTIFGTINWKLIKARARMALERHNIDVSPFAQAATLRPAVRMQLAIARCLEEGRADQDLDEAADGSARVLFLDEPTASLTIKEVDHLADALRAYSEAGTSVVFVSHRLDEMFSLADRVTILRDGIQVDEQPMHAIDHQHLAEAMLGRPIQAAAIRAEQPRSAEVLLEVAGLTSPPLQQVSFAVHRGEIVGLIGLTGAGRTELLESIVGARACSGDVRVQGRRLRGGSIGDAMAAGVAFVPEDRLAEGVFMDQSISDNVAFADIKRFWQRLIWRTREADSYAESACQRFSVRAPGVGSTLNTLSGGNQQKVVLARWLARAPRVLLLDEPTQGIDINSRNEIHDLIRDAVAEGACALIASSDLDEVAALCDRVIVLREGVVIAETTGRSTAHDLTLLTYQESA
jgi:ribose transport system ATP-binding protein